MKTLVVYKSKTGFSQKYGQWIGKALECPVMDLKDVKKSTLEAYDHIIYGGGIYASKIAGLGQIQKYVTHQDLTCFAVGSVQAPSVVMDKLKAANGLEATALFYMVGGIKVEELNFFFKLIMKKMRKDALAKADKSQGDLEFLKAFEAPYDLPKREYINGLIDHVKSKA